MLTMLRRLWNGSDLPRDTHGRVRSPSPRECGRGSLRGTHEEHLKCPPPRHVDVDWSPCTTTNAVPLLVPPVDHMARVVAPSGQRMDKATFYAMSERERLTWYYSQQRFTAPEPRHLAKLEWWGD